MAITGGIGGIDAHYDDLHTLAGLSEELAATLGSAAVAGHAVLIDPDLLASAVLDPQGVAAVEHALLAALDGGSGLTMLAGSYAGQAVKLRATVALYQATDDLQKQAFDSIAWTLGNNPVLTLGLALETAPLWAPWAAVEFAQDGGDPQLFLSNHLGLVDGVVAAAPGLLTWASGGAVAPSDVTAGGHLIGLLYPEGTATVTPDPTVTDPNDPNSELSPDNRSGNPLARVPGSIGDLVDGLDYRNGTVHPDSPDRIDVRTIVHADGTKAYIVDIPGTKVWDTPGEDPGTHLNTLGTNIHLTGGDLTAREAAIADALHQAGVTSTDPVMLVGHSQGGIIAAQAAHDAADGTFGYGGQSFNITHVVTAGSPIGRIDVPPNVQVLALENAHDIVPHLDGAANADRANVTTVTFDKQNGSLGANHDTGTSYAVAAHQLDSSTNASVRGFADSASAFLPASGSGAGTSYTAYNLERKDP